jgi:hypothetical protein
MEQFRKIIAICFCCVSVLLIGGNIYSEPVQGTSETFSENEKVAVAKLIKNILSATELQGQVAAISSFREKYAELEQKSAGNVRYTVLCFDSSGNFLLSHSNVSEREKIKYVVVMETGEVGYFSPFHVTILGGKSAGALLRPF